MASDALRARAAELGVQTSYHDVDGGLHDADDTVLDHVVQILEPDRAGAAATSRTTPPVHVAGGGSIVVSARVLDASIDVEGRPVALVVRHDASGDLLELPDDLPFGCHLVRFDADTGPGETVVVVAPATMQRDHRLAGEGSLFVPTYALWEHDRPLPSFRHLHELARRLKASGVEAVSTLPLYATFLDDPFDPSPYSPVSRLHWNEVYLDDTGLPAAEVPPTGNFIDWRTLAERRRHQLVEAATTLSPAMQDELTAYATAHPDVGAYARFRADRDAGGDLIVEQSHVLAQYLADREIVALIAYVQKIGTYREVESANPRETRPLDPDSYRPKETASTGTK